MACSSMNISPTQATSSFVLRECNGLRRSKSGNDLFPQTKMRRSLSDNHICYSINGIRATATLPKLKNSRSLGIFPFQISCSMIPNALESFLFEPETSKDMVMEEKDLSVVEALQEDNIEDENDQKEVERRANWVERLLEIRSHWRNKQHREHLHLDHEDCEVEDEVHECMRDGDEGGCDVDYGSEEGERTEMKYDRETFSRFLAQVPWSEVKSLSKLAFLCNMAYVIPDIKPDDLTTYYGLHFVTSSLEKKAEAAAIKAKLDQDSVRVPDEVGDFNSKKIDNPEQKHLIRPSVAYEIAASAASYVQSHAKGFLSKVSQSLDDEDSCQRMVQTEPEGESSSPKVYKPEEAAYVAASTMTAVVAAGEKDKQEAARDLQSPHSSPCEWLVCDDYSTCTRYFVIHGSDSLASWQANLFFEPAKFEGTEALVHRGIYEAAKGIYEQFMPNIIEHLIQYGECAKLQFTGHSLGGSLSLLVSLMLLSRKLVKPLALRPVVTFGSPFIFCSGQHILNDLGLDENHVHSVMMHRDIVPRAFSCNYPKHVAMLLKRLNGTFRSHPCLIKNKLLYKPIGKLFILQADEKSSPPHPLLPQGNALYAFINAQSGNYASALKTFLNCPHPLETLSDPTAYGSEGTILRDHDSSNYLKAVNGVLRKNTRLFERYDRKPRNALWPLLNSPSPRSWHHSNNLKSSTLARKEIVSAMLILLPLL
ncbi:hypothetical protein K2173_003425 [Erythroxylum novogranatense]|uniref:Fungal lipase-type domain-containing protein n=1 Tax=Erythroxylum novogranatense TaxID=1862640 RepID=A0AAV8S8J7_9ROSI|nr:hypothetical protein K2173_003425 [Erythroxylum novogranatense]